MAVSPQKSFVIAESLVSGSTPSSIAMPTLYRSPRAASHFVSISASFAAMSWCSAIGFPIVSRVFAYSSA